MMSILALNGMVRLRQRLASTTSKPTLKKIRSSLPVFSLNTLPLKNILPDASQQELAESLSGAYDILQKRLPFSIKPVDLSLMAIGIIVGLPIGLMIDFNAAYQRVRKIGLATGIIKKRSFTAAYSKNTQGIVLPARDTLLEELKDLADLDLKQKTYMDEARAHEANQQYGEKAQADAWAFGYLFRAAIEKATTFDDIVLLYQSAYHWLLLRIESGLKNTVADLNAEFDRVAKQEKEVLISYDEKSIPVVKKYWLKLQEDLRNAFKKELKLRQK